MAIGAACEGGIVVIGAGREPCLHGTALVGVEWRLTETRWQQGHALRPDPRSARVGHDAEEGWVGDRRIRGLHDPQVT